MPHPEPYPRCVFCGEKANSREHAIPAWVGRRFDLRKIELHDRSAEIGQEPSGRKQPIMFGSHRERIFCKDCNKHFKQLEDEAADLVEWMARGRSITLGPTEQDVLARWGAKTGYALIAAERNFRDLVPRDHMAFLRIQDEPHALSWVAYGSWDGAAHKLVGENQAVAGPSGGPIRAHRIYHAQLSFGQLLPKFAGFFRPLAPPLRVGFDAPMLRQVWPRVDHQNKWPTTPPFSEGDWETLGQVGPVLG